MRQGRRWVTTRSMVLLLGVVSVAGYSCGGDDTAAISPPEGTSGGATSSGNGGGSGGVGGGDNGGGGSGGAGSSGGAGGADGSGGTGGTGGDGGGTQPRLCDPARSHEQIPQRHSATVEEALDTFSNLSGEIEIQCGNCHKAPAEQGDFSYTGTPENLCNARGKSGKTPVDVMLSGEMPYKIGGQEALGRRLQAWIEQGCPAGTYILPKGDLHVDPDGDFVTPREVGDALTELGNCIPNAEIVGRDEEVDERFAAMRSFADLPVKLSETDFISLDAEVLARRGTLAYAPAYPLWSDDAAKLRFVHVPAGQAITYDPDAKSIRIPPNTRFYKTFFRAVVEPDGVTRYRKMETRIIVTRELAEDAIFGTYVWNAEETTARLLGTGLDPASPDSRELYLNGEPFPDYVRPYTADETTGALQSYAVPGATRCVACHSGSESESFVLGITPFQLHKRPKGEGGVYTPDVLADELNQLERLLAYGVVRGTLVTLTPDDFPKLKESALPRLPRNADELNMQAYMAGNCAHCHNPRGYAVASKATLRGLDMSPGGSVFGFRMDAVGSDGVLYFPRMPTPFNELDMQNAIPNGGIYRRVVLPTGAWTPREFGLPVIDEEISAFFNLHMPMHTASVDCRLPVLVARWWASVPRDYERGGQEAPEDPEAIELAMRAADAAEARALHDCEQHRSIGWVLEDTTERYPYVPRNIDWKTKLDDWIRAEEVTSEHEALAKKAYAQGFFLPGCAFPGDAPEPDTVEQWMINPGTGRPLRPWSAIYWANPGEHIYAGICSNCHGIYGDAQTGASRALRATSGARVASFVDGLFGPRWAPSENLATFHGPAAGEDDLGPDGAAKYLVWMATGGTTVSFGRTPEEERTFFNVFVNNRIVTAVPIPLDLATAKAAFKRSRANMLGVARAACDEIRTDAHRFGASYDAAAASGSWSLILSNAVAPEFGVPMWRDVCTLRNPLTDGLRAADASSPEVDAWLRRAVFNAGVMAYIYMRDELTKGVIAVPRDACALKFPR
jgi:mono/diheme cytochrome c family protein